MMPTSSRYRASLLSILHEARDSYEWHTCKGAKVARTPRMTLGMALALLHEHREAVEKVEGKPLEAVLDAWVEERSPCQEDHSSEPG